MKHIHTPFAFAPALVTMTLIAGCAAPNPMQSTAQSNAIPVTVITHLDIARTGLDAAGALLRDYAAESRTERGNLQVEVLKQSNATNHFTLVERWASRDTYETHVNGNTARTFHQQLDPLFGSPHDERVYHVVGVPSLGTQ